MLKVLVCKYHGFGHVIIGPCVLLLVHCTCYLPSMTPLWYWLRTACSWKIRNYWMENELQWCLVHKKYVSGSYIEMDVHEKPVSERVARDQVSAIACYGGGVC